MERYFKRSILALLLVLVLTGPLVIRRGHAETLSMPAAQATQSATKTVQVSGTGEIQVQPDSAVINLGVQTEAETAREALDENNTRMQSLLDTLEEADIPAEDIQTQMLHLSPLYEFNNDRRTLVGYTATNIVEVRVSDLDSLGELVDQAVSDGANTVENINFEASNPESVTDQARQSAFQNARHKAEELAELANGSLGPVVEIRETSTSPGPVPRPFETADQAAAVPVSPGSQAVHVEVQVIWTLLVNNEQ